MKKQLLGASIFILFVLLGITSIIRAHSPINEDNTQSDNIVEINDPTKSWAIYSELEGKNDVKYYSFEIEKGQNIYLSLHVPSHVDKNFSPKLLLLGPGLPKSTKIPSLINLPGDVGSLELNYYNPPQKFFEPFTPSILIVLGELDISAPESGKYYIAIYSDNVGGSFGFALGRRESFTIAEIFFLPVQIIRIYQWEGQPLFLIFLPSIIVLITGFGFILWYRKTHGKPDTLINTILVIAGIVLLGTTANLSYQVIQKVILFFSIEVFFSLFFILVPLYIGLRAFKTGLQSIGEYSLMKRLKHLFFGIVLIIMWSGLYIAPFLLIATSLIPKNLEFSTNEPNK